ncbi:MAG: hypothetical protein ABR554_17175 [Pyrinomonadaceae bacterium]
MPEQDNSTRLDGDEQGSGLLRSVEPAGGAGYSMSAPDADASDKTSDSDSNKDILGGGDAGSSDTDGSDADGTDGDGTDKTDGDSGGGEGGDADGTDFGEDSDSSDATADADGTDG